MLDIFSQFSVSMYRLPLPVIVSSHFRLLSSSQ